MDATIIYVTVGGMYAVAAWALTARLITAIFGQEKD